MDAVRMVLVLLLAVVVSRVLARLSPIKLPLPLLQIGIGAALSFVIGFNVRLDPDVFLFIDHVRTNKSVRAGAGVALGLLAGMAYLACIDGASASELNPANFPRVGTIDERYQSFNVEMLEVTGGNFWKPYQEALVTPGAPEVPPAATVPAGMDPRLYEYRPPINLSNPRLRRLAAALGPVYMRVSGTWANSTYFDGSDPPARTRPPAGFNGILTRQQWEGAVDFSRAVVAKIVTSFATSPGTREADGVWTPREAHKFLTYNRSIGGVIAAAEFMNEPTLAEMGGAPKGYTAASYERDLEIFRPFLRRTDAGIVLLGPGSVGEGGMMRLSIPSTLKTEDLMTAAGPVFDAFSYHSYGAASQRCASMGQGALTSADAALSPEWLGQTLKIDAFYRAIRDRFEPGKPVWITETADATCGGNPWASTFLDSFRYLHQLGAMARGGVQVVIHNTLASSDYGLLDEHTYAPRPNYWAALLWRKFMGATVLDAGPTPSPNLYLYAHCLRSVRGGVVLLVINADRTSSQSFELPVAADRYTLTAPQGASNLQSDHVELNGNALHLTADDAVPPIRAVPAPAGRLTFPPETISFLALPKAGNNSCQ